MNYPSIGNKPKQRNSNFELLRIIAMLLIILYHFSIGHSPVVQSSPLCINKILAIITGSWGIAGVNCFFFLSAWFLQRKERNFKAIKLFSIVFQVIFYAVLVLSIGHLTGILSVNFITVNQALIFWYVITYCIMYLLSPYLNKFIYTCKDETLKKLVLLLTILFPLQLFFYPITEMSNTGLVIYDYLLIAFLQRKENNFFEKYRFSGAFITFIIVILAEIAIIYNFQDTKWLLEKFMGRYSIFQIIAALFIFYIFKNLKFQVKTINVLAKSTLAIYILHEGVLSGFIRNDIFKLDLIYLESYYIIYLLCTAITVYLAFTFVDFFRSLIYNQFMNIFNPYISKINLKINTWYNNI